VCLHQGAEYDLVVGVVGEGYFSERRGGVSIAGHDRCIDGSPPDACNHSIDRRPFRIDPFPLLVG
jgi:hypothetical protein